MSNVAIRWARTFLFSVGVLVGLTIVGAAVWADLEAKFYGFDKLSDEPLPGVWCPVIMTADKGATISAALRNPTDKPLEIMLRADFSSRGPMRRERSTVSLAPGERQRVRWTVTSADVDLGFFVLAAVGHYPAYPLPFRQTTCGIVAVPVPLLSGNQLFAIALAVSLVGMAGGLALFERGSRPLSGRVRFRALALRFLAVIVVAGMIASLVGAWAIGGALLVVATLTIVVTLSTVAME